MSQQNRIRKRLFSLGVAAGLWLMGAGFALSADLAVTVPQAEMDARLDLRDEFNRPVRNAVAQQEFQLLELDALAQALFFKELPVARNFLSTFEMFWLGLTALTFPSDHAFDRRMETAAASFSRFDKTCLAVCGLLSASLTCGALSILASTAPRSSFKPPIPLRC
ncbi:MAG: hypothetical protein HY611_05770 [Elusimicrobia bacterium]|nr:hypothetical protein [Elusimicrobiota bacterium]